MATDVTSNFLDDYQLALRLQAECDAEDAQLLQSSSFEEQSSDSLNSPEDVSRPISIDVDEESGRCGESEVKPISDDRPESLVHPKWELIDPNPDVRALFVEYDKNFFWGTLNGVEVRWSPRMTSCAGLCVYEGHGGLCSIRLSEPLLKLRPRSDLVETLLHEMIHAYLFVTNNNKDHDDHGENFHLHMKRLRELTGVKITVYHNFLDEVASYQNHWWLCDGPCRSRKPFHGYVRRAMNRAPGPNDTWWEEHQATCGGTFHKIKEPEGYGEKKTKKKKDDKMPVSKTTTTKTLLTNWLSSANHSLSVNDSGERSGNSPYNSDRSSSVGGNLLSKMRSETFVTADKKQDKAATSSPFATPGDFKLPERKLNTGPAASGAPNFLAKALSTAGKILYGKSGSEIDSVSVTQDTEDCTPNSVKVLNLRGMSISAEGGSGQADRLKRASDPQDGNLRKRMKMSDGSNEKVTPTQSRGVLKAIQSDSALIRQKKTTEQYLRDTSVPEGQVIFVPNFLSVCSPLHRNRKSKSLPGLPKFTSAESSLVKSEIKSSATHGLSNKPSQTTAPPAKGFKSEFSLDRDACVSNSGTTEHKFADLQKIKPELERASFKTELSWAVKSETNEKMSLSDVKVERVKAEGGDSKSGVIVIEDQWEDAFPPTAAAQAAGGGGALVSCPVCQSCLPETEINQHLDICLA